MEWFTRLFWPTGRKWNKYLHPYLLETSNKNWDKRLMAQSEPPGTNIMIFPRQTRGGGREGGCPLLTQSGWIPKDVRRCEEHFSFCVSVVTKSTEGRRLARAKHYVWGFNWFITDHNRCINGVPGNKISVTASVDWTGEWDVTIFFFFFCEIRKPSCDIRPPYYTDHLASASCKRGWEREFNYCAFIAL